MTTYVECLTISLERATSGGNIVMSLRNSFMMIMVYVRNEGRVAAASSLIMVEAAHVVWDGIMESSIRDVKF